MTSPVKWSDLQKTAKEATELLPDGEYRVQIDTSESVIASTGSQMIKLTMHITEGVYSKSKRKLFTNIVLSPESGFALVMLFDKLKGLGVGQDVFDREASFDEIAGMLKDAEVTAVVGKGKPFGNPPRQNNEVTAFKNGRLSSGAGSISADDSFVGGGIEF